MDLISVFLALDCLFGADRGDSPKHGSWAGFQGLRYLIEKIEFENLLHKASVSFCATRVASSGHGGYSYLLEPLCWLGLITNGHLLPVGCSKLVQASMSLIPRTTLTLTLPRTLLALRSFSCKMSSDPPPLTHSLTLPSQLAAEPVQIVAAPHISSSQFRSAIDSSLFKQWLKNMESETGILSDGSLALKRVLIQGVDMFGKRIGFLKFEADVIDKETGEKVPGIVFARGPAVAVLILLESEGKAYAVLTEQVRVPVGRIILELPAGMLDDDKGDFLGTAIREVEEETGICLKQED
ncbi:nudix hydrolase 14, chloroplastic-like [Rosa rugosa]|uniref:nudix hydrolase 14, chloroplastic-like n=1 Tax=Rosa rugosa TaxID=74645 RepID=UPI002B415998|nr:nudix hydrolase 14, chloroplastic-like [Rosa rugosa]XP_062013907.1 nudix hydrolase 14, chloroplastic-like [Rosa rugosa]